MPAGRDGDLSRSTTPGDAAGDCQVASPIGSHAKLRGRIGRGALHVALCRLECSARHAAAGRGESTCCGEDGSRNSRESACCRRRLLSFSCACDARSVEGPGDVFRWLIPVVADHAGLRLEEGVLRIRLKLGVMPRPAEAGEVVPGENLPPARSCQSGRVLDSSRSGR